MPCPEIKDCPEIPSLTLVLSDRCYTVYLLICLCFVCICTFGTLGPSKEALSNFGKFKWPRG